MKISKKTIAIILLVAVAAYLLYKKSRMTVADTGGTVESTPAATDSIESLIAASGMTASDAAFVRSFRDAVNASNVRREQIEQKAVINGYTFQQQLVLDAIWSKYYDNATANFKPEYANSSTVKNYVWKVFKAVKEA